MLRDALRNALAEVLFQRWADWRRELHQRAAIQGNGTMVIAREQVMRGTQMMGKTYARLPEDAQAQFQREVDTRVMPLFITYVDTWLASHSHDGNDDFMLEVVDNLRDHWMNEMVGEDTMLPLAEFERANPFYWEEADDAVSLGEATPVLVREQANGSEEVDEAVWLAPPEDEETEALGSDELPE